MSLWTPYDPDQALDLSKSSKIVKPKEESNYSPIRDESSDFQLSPTLYSQYSPYQGLSPSPPQLVPGYYEATQPAVTPSRARKLSTGSRHVTRPFKAVTAALPELQAAGDPDRHYAAFRAAMLEAIRARSGGSSAVCNPRMRRAVHRSSCTEDGDYHQRRARNNLAAKRSRDLRRQQEDELAIRAAYLERLNAGLRGQVAAASRCPQCHAGLL